MRFDWMPLVSGYWWKTTPRDFFFMRNLAILSWSLRRDEGVFFFCKVDVVPGRETGILAEKLVNTVPFLVSRKSLACSPLLLHSWKASRSMLIVVPSSACILFTRSRPPVVGAELLLTCYPGRGHTSTVAEVTLVLRQRSLHETTYLLARHIIQKFEV